MSFEGTFYAITDSQLNSLLNQSLDGDAFLQGQTTEAPLERFSGAGSVWYELTQLLGPEDGCGAEATEVIPEGGAYSDSNDVVRISAQLNQLEPSDLERRYAELETSVQFKELDAAIVDLRAFYQRSANAGLAVLFNIR